MPGALMAMRRGVLAKPGAFDPLTLSPSVWFKPETLSALSDGNAVTSWPDSSGNGRDAANGNGTQQPLYKTAIQNGKAVVRFDGSNDTLLTAAFTLNQPTHVIFVGVWRTAAGDQSIIDGAGVSMLVRQQGTRTIDVFAGVGFSGPSNVTDVWRQYACVFNGASSEIRVDGGAATTGNAGASNAGRIFLGARQGPSSPGAVDIGEVLVFNSVLSSTNRQLVEGYLRTKWGTA